MPKKVLRVSFARYAFCGHKPFLCILLGESPKTPVIYIGAPLFDALFEKVLHFLAHLLRNGSTFWRTFFEDNLSCLGRCNFLTPFSEKCSTFWHTFWKMAPLFDAPFQIHKYHSETTSSIICLSILLLTYVLPKHVHHNIFFFVFINNLEANIFVHLHCIVCFLYCQGSFLISSFF